MTGTETAPAPGAGAARVPPGHRHLGLALLVICAAQLMVVLDASIVNVALPSIQRALHFSAADLIWVVNGYTLAFGGLLLLGGRAGDLFGRRRMFVIGVAVFTGASLAGGLATGGAWLVAARVVQGIGGAVAAPTALALIADTFPEGRARNRAMGVYAALTGAGAAIGVLLGGALTSALGWRWVLFVNVPIGVVVALAAPMVLAETQTRRGRLDMGGAVTATGGMTLLVYGFIHAATTSWGDRWTLACLVTGAVVLVAFVVLEARSRHALMPLRIFRSRNRSATYAIVLAVGTAIFSMFYFGTLFMQEVLGFGPLRAGVAYLGPSLTVVVLAGLTSLLMGRVRTKILLVVGCAMAAAGLAWFSTVDASSTYVHGLLGPLLVTAAGMGVCFVPLTSGAIAGVAPSEEGIASALLNAGQQIGGTLGLAILGSVAAGITRSRLAMSLRALGPPSAGPVTRAAGSAPAAHGPAPTVSGLLASPAAHHAVASALVTGYTTAFAVGAGIMVFALVLSAVALDGRIPAHVPGRAGSPPG